MPFIDLSETLAGTGEVTGTLITPISLSVGVGGVGAVSATPVLTFLMGGQVSGYVTLSLGFSKVLEGAAVGVGTTSVTPVLIGSLWGTLRGVGNLRDSVPLPISGHGTLSAYMEVLPIQPPLCGADNLRRFPFMLPLQQGDLSLSLCDGQGNPYSPVEVTYSLYRVVAGGYRQLVGHGNRTPVQSGVGQYYVAGYLGECGQPGEWVVVWHWSNGSDCLTQEESFVLEAGPPISGHCAKYGWA